MDNSGDNFKSFNSSNKLGSFSYLLREQSSKIISFKKIKTNRARKRRIKSMETINSKEEFKITVNPIKNVNLLKSDVFNVKIPYYKHKTVFPLKKFHSRSVSVSPQTTHRKLATQTLSATFRPQSKERKAISKYTKFLDELLSRQTATKTVSTQKRVFDLAEEEKMMSAYGLSEYVREKARCLVRGEPSLPPTPHLSKTNIVDKAVENLKRRINFNDSGNCCLGQEMVVIMIETEIQSIVASLEATGNIVKLKGFSSKTGGNDGSVMFPMINQELQIRKEQAIPVQKRKVSTVKQRKNNLFTIKDESDDNQSDHSAKERNSKANMQALFDLLKGDDFIERNIEAISKNMPFAMKDESSTDRALVEPKRQIISTKQVKVLSVEENIKKMEKVIQNSSLKTDKQILESLKENKKSVKNAFLSLINVSEEDSSNRSGSLNESISESVNLSDSSSLSISLSDTASVQDEEGNKIDSKMVLVMDKGVFVDREGRIIRKNTLSRSEKGETISLESNKKVIIINVKGEEVDLEGEVVKTNGQVRNFKVNRRKTFKKVKFDENVEKFEYKKKFKRRKDRDSSPNSNKKHSDRELKKRKKHGKRAAKERKRTRNAKMRIQRSFSLNRKDSKKEEKEHRKIYKKYKSIRFYGIKKEVYPNYYTEETKDLDCTYLTGRDEFNTNKEIENKEKVRRIIGKYKEIREKRDSKRAKRDAFKQETLQEPQTQNIIKANRKYKELVEKEESSTVKLVPVEKMRKRTFKSSKKLLLNISKEKKTEQTTKGRTTLNSREKSHKERLTLNSREKQKLSNKNSDLKNIIETKKKPKKKGLVKIIKKKKNKSKQKKKENTAKTTEKDENDSKKENEEPILTPKSPKKSMKSKISSPLKRKSSPLKKQENKEMSKELKEEALFIKNKQDKSANKLYSKVVSSSNSHSVSKHNSSKHLQGIRRQSNMDEMYKKLKGRVTNSNNSKKSLINLKDKFEVNSPGNTVESDSESELDEVEVLHSDQNDTLTKLELLKKLGIDLTDPKFLKLSKREIEEVVKNKKSDKIWEMVFQ